MGDIQTKAQPVRGSSIVRGCKKVNKPISDDRLESNGNIDTKSKGIIPQIPYKIQINEDKRRDPLRDYSGEEIRQTFEFFTAPMTDPIMEVRIIEDDYNTHSGFYNFEGMPNCTDIVKAYDDSAIIYFTMNQIHPDLIYRQYNRLKQRAKKTVSDGNIIMRYWLLIDFDPNRLSGISSSDEEKEQSKLLCLTIVNFLHENYGFPVPVFADSGNGWHSYYRICMENDGPATLMIEEFLHSLSTIFSTQTVTVDETVFNAARITKLHGTLACKGSNTVVRPHRRSELLIPDKPIVVLTADQIYSAIEGMRVQVESIKKEKNVKKDKTKSKSNNDITNIKTTVELSGRSNKKGKLNIKQWMTDYGINFIESKPDANGTIKYHITCPFHDDHEATIFVDATGALGFNCFHDRCKDKHWKDVRLLFEPNVYKRKSKADITFENTTIFADEYCTINSNGKYRPKPLTENIETLLETLDITLTYNELIKDLEVDIPDENVIRASQDNRDEIVLQYLFNETVKHDFQKMPKELLRSIIVGMGDKNKYNPVKLYLNKSYKKYKEDIVEAGETELDKLLNTIISPVQFNQQLKRILVTKWLVSCVKAIKNTNGISAHGVLIFQGAQGLGKTTWFRNLVPDDTWFNEGFSLDTSNKDSVLSVVKYWIVELGEIGSTFKRDLDSLKAFITRPYDELRVPYGRSFSKYARRTIFCGTVNPDTFLQDETGSRRFWTIPVSKINYQYLDDINLSKLWAEIVHLEKNGELSYLTREEEAMLNASNKRFETRNYIDTLIESSFDWELDERYWLKASDVFVVLGKIKELSSDKIGKSLSKLDVPKKVLRGTTLYALPRLKQSSDDLAWSYKQANISKINSDSNPQPKTTLEDCSL